MYMAGLLYCGAGLGILIIYIVRRLIIKKETEVSIGKKDLPYLLGIIGLDAASLILTMLALSASSAANISLINNMEVVATALIAFFIFKEKISSKLWVGIILITISSVILSVDFTGNFSFSIGSIYAALSCICWGLDNNLIRKIADKNPFQIAIIKGFGSGGACLLIGLLFGNTLMDFNYVGYALALGSISYGVSVFFYMMGQRGLGAAKASTYFGTAPFISVILALIVFNEVPNYYFYIALVVMFVGMIFVTKDRMGSKGDKDA